MLISTIFARRYIFLSYLLRASLHQTLAGEKGVFGTCLGLWEGLRDGLKRSLWDAGWGDCKKCSVVCGRGLLEGLRESAGRRQQP